MTPSPSSPAPEAAPSAPAPDGDIALMLRLSAGDESAFAPLLARHQTPLMNFFTRMGASIHDAEDLTQESFMRLWNYRTRYRPAAKFTTFLYTLARHAWFDHLRKQNRFARFFQRYLEEAPESSDGGIPQTLRNLDLQSALSLLPEKQREVLVLAVCQGQSYADISQVLSIPVGTVKSRVFNALKTLQALQTP